MCDVRKLFYGCFCFLLVLGTWAQAANVIENGDFGTGDLTGWSLVKTSSATGDMFAQYSAAEGRPAGSVRCWTPSAVSTNSHRFLQMVPVNKGQKYKLDGDWKGNIRGINGTVRMWAEGFVGFRDGLDGAETSAIRYKKTIIGPLNTSSDPNLAGIWDWESMLASPSASSTPANGIYTATGSYMLFWLNIGGRADACSEEFPAYVYLDNFRILPCHNDECTDYSADFKYIAWVANNWLGCGIDPPTSCY